MIVVSDTSPLNYLILIEAVEVLPRLYKQVFIPPKVLQELADSGSPASVRSWATLPPAWLIVQTPMKVDPTLNLHAGEAQAIALAQELKAERLLIDERRGRDAAKARGLNVVGMLGVLYEASGEKLVDLSKSLDRLKNDTNFHCDPKIIAEVLRRNAARDITNPR